jgi:phosphopantothenoylcysteine decarboxylase/phosphopantothenate--cysteine ligase
MTNIVLAAGASAALHKSCDLASKLAQDGHAVRAVLTRRAASLVSPQLFEALTGEAAWVDEFDAGRRGGMDHISLAQWAQLFLVAPCPADLLSRLALGLADDLVTTVALALAPEIPRLVCPAMNPNMWAAPAVVRNRETLIADGWQLLEPGAGHMACGVEGQGRMMEPADILDALRVRVG